jgi:aryl-alcohol dehydrogenase-like predicted oxidoreductase
MNGLEEKNFDTILDKVEALKPIAESVGATLAQLAIAWVCTHSHPLPPTHPHSIPKRGRRERGRGRSINISV